MLDTSRLKTPFVVSVTGLATALMVMSCSSDMGDSAGSAAAPRASNNADSGGYVNPSDNNNDDNGFVPEVEERFQFQAPRSSQNYVFVANTSLDSVAKVNAQTLEITSIEAGDHPTVVRTYQLENLAVVLNEGSDEVTIIRAGERTDDVLNLPIPAGMNQIQLAPNGDFAVAYFDFLASDEDLDPLEAPPLQDVALIKLEQGDEEVYHLTVGFQVMGVEFDDDGSRAFVITRTGASVVQLAEIHGDKLVPPVPLAEIDPQQDMDREVEVTADGSFAFVRSSGLMGLNVVELDNGDTTTITLDAAPTDLDLFPGESRAIAVIRQTNELAIIALPEALEAPDAVPTLSLGDEPVGLATLTPDASRALLYTTTEERQAITVVDVDAQTFETYPLRKGVRGVTTDARGEVAVIFHSKMPGTPIPGEDEDSFIAKSWAYSIFDIHTGYSKIQTVPSEPGEFVFSDASRTLYVLFSDPATEIQQVEIVDLGTFRTTTLSLGSPPEHVGEIPNGGNPKIYISQEHPVGRMTFIEELSSNVKTVTGYQLNSLIE